MSRRVIYSRGFPYGAPLVVLRGGGLKISGVKGYLREQGFTWDGQLHGWKSYMYAPEFRMILGVLKQAYGCEILPKDNLDPDYVLDAV